MKQAYISTVSGEWTTEPKTDTQYAIEETDSSITVKFQGSLSLIDWIQNFMFWKKLYRGSCLFCHRGFGIKWKSVQDTIMPKVNLAIVKGKSVSIRGFSQGAALAELLHEDVYYHHKIQSDTIVFGKPRVFVINRKLKERLSGITRVENGNDIVCRIPFAVQFYKHYGKLVHIGTKNKWWKLSIKDHRNYGENL